MILCTAENLLVSLPAHSAKFCSRWFLSLQDKEGTDLAEQVGRYEDKEQSREDTNRLGSTAHFGQRHLEGSQATA